MGEGLVDEGTNTKKANQKEAMDMLQGLRNELRVIPLSFRCKKPHHKIEGATIARISGLAKILETTELNHSRRWTNGLKDDLDFLIENGLGEAQITYKAIYDEHPDSLH